MLEVNDQLWFCIFSGQLENTCGTQDSQAGGPKEAHSMIISGTPQPAVHAAIMNKRKKLLQRLRRLLVKANFFFVYYFSFNINKSLKKPRRAGVGGHCLQGRMGC